LSRPQLAIGCALLCLLVAAPVAAASPDHVIVQWAAGADHSDKLDARGEADVAFQRDLGDRDFQLVEVEPGQTLGDAVQALASDPAVAVAEADGFDTPDAIPNDPLFGQLWGLRNLGAGIKGVTGAVAGDDVNAVLAWDRTVGTPSTVIADIDSGYRFDYPDLGSVAWSNPGEVANGLDDDGNGIVDDIHGADFVGLNGEAPTIDGNPTDDDLLSGGHGVHTAGTMGAAGNNGVGITGVAQNARIMPLRACGRYPGQSDNLCPPSAQISAINYAGSKGARVANMSLGSTTFRQTVVNAIAANPRVLYVISAGNDGENNEVTHHYPCDYRPAVEASPAVPGAIDNVVCVAATNQGDKLASFSDYGAASVDLGAPGTEILSTYPFFNPVNDHFSANDFASKWTATGASGGFARSNEAPLTSFGMTDSPGATPAANTIRESTSVAASIPAGLAPCTLLQTRTTSLGAGASYTYSVLLNGSTVDSVTLPELTSSSATVPRELGTKLAGGGSVQVRFRYSSGTAPAAGNGVWLDDIQLQCAEPIGSASNYDFLQGTSMAAPHVSGAAGLLFSLKPTANVTEVRNAILAGVRKVPSLTGRTVTGGRLDIAAALNALVPLPPPAPAPVPAPAPCVVPKLIGKPLAKAKLALRRNACKVGKVQKPRRRKGQSRPILLVKSSKPSAGKTTYGSVSLKLGPKPKPKRRHH
jgi:subtilisin family serine protease